MRPTPSPKGNTTTHHPPPPPSPLSLPSGRAALEKGWALPSLLKIFGQHQFSAVSVPYAQTFVGGKAVPQTLAEFAKSIGKGRGSDGIGGGKEAEGGTSKGEAPLYHLAQPSNRSTKTIVCGK